MLFLRDATVEQYSKHLEENINCSDKHSLNEDFNVVETVSLVVRNCPESLCVSTNRGVAGLWRGGRGQRRDGLFAALEGGSF